MKYKNIIDTLQFLEKDKNVKFNVIDLIHDDFLLIVNELNVNINSDIFGKYINVNNIKINSVDENKVLKRGSATFMADKDFNKERLNKNLYTTLFRTEKILSNEERVIKELLE